MSAIQIITLVRIVVVDIWMWFEYSLRIFRKLYKYFGSVCWLAMWWTILESNLTAGKIFRTCPDTLGPTQSPIQWVPDYTRVKVAGAWR